MWASLFGKKLPKVDYFQAAKEAFKSGSSFPFGIHICYWDHNKICEDPVSKEILNKTFNATEINELVTDVETLKKFYLEAKRVYDISLTGTYVQEDKENDPKFRKDVDEFLHNTLSNELIVNFIKVYMGQGSNLLNSSTQSFYIFLAELNLLPSESERKIRVKRINEKQWQIQDFVPYKIVAPLDNPFNPYPNPSNEQASLVTISIYTINLSNNNEITVQQHFDVCLNETADPKVQKPILEKVDLPAKKAGLKKLIVENEFLENPSKTIDTLSAQFVCAVDMLLANHQSLETTQLTIPNDATKDVAVILARSALTTNTTLKKLKLVYADLTLPQLGVLLSFLLKNKTLNELDLSANKIDENFIKVFEHNLVNNKLPKITIDLNKISDQNVKQKVEKLIAEGTLKTNDVIRDVNKVEAKLNIITNVEEASNNDSFQVKKS